MKKNKSMLGAIVVATILCVSVLASSVFATDSFEFTGGTVTKYTGTKTNVTVPSTDGGTTITTISANAFDGCDDVTVVYLPSTITTVETGAFSGCSADVKVIFDMDSPTASVPAGMENWGVNNAGGTITYYMEGGNTTMTLSDVGKISSTTKYAYIKDGDIAKVLDTDSSILIGSGRIETITYTNTSTADVGAVDVSKAQDNSVMMWVDGVDLYFWFEGDRLVMPENMQYYYVCRHDLTDIIGMDFFDTSNVTNMSSMFEEIPYLTSVDVSSFDTSNVTDMSLMFANSHTIINLDLSSFDMSNVNDVDEMFSGCDDLTTVYTRTQADADIIKASTNLPSTTTVIVK